MQTCSNNQTLDSEYFTLHELCDGVFAAISNEGAGSWSNAGIVDLGDKTLVFDTFATVPAAIALQSAAERLTGRPPTYVVNSHAHIDHYHGNQAFPGAGIISTLQTREQMASRYPRFAASVKSHPEELDKLAHEMEQETDTHKWYEKKCLLGEFTAIAKTIESTELRLPSITFQEHLVIHGSHRSVELRCYGGGHSVSDTFLYLPEDKIAFMADLLHVGYHGEFTTGNVDEWIRILDKVLELDIEMTVSGHGGMGTKVSLRQMRQYLLDVKQHAVELFQTGANPDDLQNIRIPEAYQDLLAPSVFPRNVQTLVRSHLQHNNS